MTLSPGTSLGPYQIESVLGKGGMGEVYRARDTRLQRDVAIKVLPQSTDDETSLKRFFQREAKALAALSHPNILTIFDVGTEQGVSFVVTELLNGEALRNAQLKFIHGGDSLLGKQPEYYKHPYFWAPFFLVGDAGPL